MVDSEDRGYFCGCCPYRDRMPPAACAIAAEASKIAPVQVGDMGRGSILSVRGRAPSSNSRIAPLAHQAALSNTAEGGKICGG